MTTSSLNILIDSVALQTRIVKLLEEYLIQFYPSSKDRFQSEFMSNTFIDHEYIPTGDDIHDNKKQVVVVYVNPQSRKFAEDFYTYLRQKSFFSSDQDFTEEYKQSMNQNDALLYISDCQVSDIRGKEVILLHNLIENENAVTESEETIRLSSPNSICSISLLCPHNIESQADFVGFTIPIDRIVGYGLSWKGHFQQLYHISTIS